MNVRLEIKYSAGKQTCYARTNWKVIASALELSAKHGTAERPQQRNSFRCISRRGDDAMDSCLIGGTPPSEEFILLVLCWCCTARQTAPLGNTVIAVCEYQAILEQGALLVIDEGRARIRILPLQRRV